MADKPGRRRGFGGSSEEPPSGPGDGQSAPTGTPLPGPWPDGDASHDQPAAEGAPTVTALSIIREGAVQGFQQVWRVVRTGWFFALFFLIVAVEGAIRYHRLDEHAHSLAHDNLSILQDYWTQGDRLAAPRPIATISDLQWYLETEWGHKQLENRGIGRVDWAAFIANLKVVKGAPGKEQRVYATTTPSGQAWVVRIVDAVALEAVTPTSAVQSPSASPR